VVELCRFEEGGKISFPLEAASAEARAAVKAAEGVGVADRSEAQGLDGRTSGGYPS
jgi:hypothetical protein